MITENSLKYTVTYAKAGDKTEKQVEKAMLSTYDDKDVDNVQQITVTYVDNDINSATKGESFVGNVNICLLYTSPSPRDN